MRIAPTGELRQRQPPLRDRTYLDSFEGEACWSCGQADGTVVGAHIRWGQEGGMGMKPSDDLVVPLCSVCHADQESSPGPEWWADLVKRNARRRYRDWKEKRG